MGGVSKPVQNLMILATSPPELTVLGKRSGEPSEKAGAVKLVSISPSVIAFQGPEPSVTSEEVAAVKNPPRPFAPSTPMVIRGGIVGDPFSTAKPPKADTAKATDEKPGAIQTSTPGKEGVEGGEEQTSRREVAPSEQKAPAAEDKPVPPQPAPAKPAASRQAAKPE